MSGSFFFKLTGRSLTDRYRLFLVFLCFAGCFVLLSMYCLDG